MTWKIDWKKCIKLYLDSWLKLCQSMWPLFLYSSHIRVVSLLKRTHGWNNLWGVHIDIGHLSFIHHLWRVNGVYIYLFWCAFTSCMHLVHLILKICWLEESVDLFQDGNIHKCAKTEKKIVSLEINFWVFRLQGGTSV